MSASASSTAAAASFPATPSVTAAAPGSGSVALSPAAVAVAVASAARSVSPSPFQSALPIQRVMLHCQVEELLALMGCCRATRQVALNRKTWESLQKGVLPLGSYRTVLHHTLARRMLLPLRQFRVTLTHPRMQRWAGDVMMYEWQCLVSRRWHPTDLDEFEDVDGMKLNVDLVGIGLTPATLRQHLGPFRRISHRIVNLRFDQRTVDDDDDDDVAFIKELTELLLANVGHDAAHPLRVLDFNAFPESELDEPREPMRSLKDSAVLHLVDYLLPRLQHLEVLNLDGGALAWQRGGAFTSARLADALVQLPALRELHLNNFMWEELVKRDTLPNCRVLEVLVARNCNGGELFHTNHAQCDIEFVESLQRCKSLHTLDLRGSSITPLVIPGLIKLMDETSIQRVDLRDMRVLGWNDELQELRDKSVQVQPRVLLVDKPPAAVDPATLPRFPPVDH